MIKKFIFLFLIACLLPMSAFALRADINKDGHVDLKDLSILSEEWLMIELGPELVLNGNFLNDSFWNFPVPWTWDAGEFASYIRGTLASGDLSQILSVSTEYTYRIIIEVSNYHNESENVLAGVVFGTAAPITPYIIGDGIYSWDISPDTDNNPRVWIFTNPNVPANSTLNINNVSVQKHLGLTTLAISPAELLQSYTTDVITLLQSPLGATEWPAYIGSMPDGDLILDDVACFYDTTGFKDGRLSNGITTQHYGVQLKVRSTEHEDGQNKIESICNAFDSVNDYLLVQDDEYYKIFNISKTSPVISLGNELESTKRRFLFTVNFLVSVRQLV